MFFLGLKFWPKVILLGLRSKDTGIFLGCNKNRGIFLGMLKKVVIFLGRQILKL